MPAKKYGLDTGTNDIRLYDSISDKFFIEADMLAVKNKKEFIAAGNEAYALYEKTSQNIVIQRPFGCGTVTDETAAVKLLTWFFNHSGILPQFLKSSEFYVAVANNDSAVQKKAFRNIMAALGLRRHNTLMIPKPLAAACGAGADILSPCAVMLIDIGACTSEISVITLGNVVKSCLIKIGGNDINLSIIQTIRERLGLLIGNRSAESLKRQMAYIGRPNDNLTHAMSVYGRDMLSGLPAEREVCGRLVAEAVRPVYEKILQETKLLLEQLPPELSMDIIRASLILTGGTANICGTKHFFAERLKMSVCIPARPEDCVIHGLKYLMSEKKNQLITAAFRDFN